MSITDTGILTNFYVSASRPDNQFEEHYLNARRKERRVYADSQVAALPCTFKDDLHHEEWQIRKRSCDRLIKYLRAKKRPLHILEIGCGNGWLSNQLSMIPGAQVVGADINLVELQQACRVFPKKSKLKFIYGDIRSGMLNDMKFDLILFAASVQYFSSLPEIINTALGRLTADGEVHIVDSPFYSPGQVAAARERSRQYFEQLGIPEMTSHYYHHAITGLNSFYVQVLSNPRSLLNRLTRRHPFFWISIRNH